MTENLYFKVLYDSQREICQACVSWLQILDRRRITRSIPVDADALRELDPRLEVEACLRELHVLGPDGELYTGWDAVARLARLFSLTWILGAAGSIPPIKQLYRLVYRFVARNRHSLSKCRGGACRVAKPDAVRKQANASAFWSCYTAGFLIRLPLVVWSAIRGGFNRVWVFFASYQRRVDLLDGKLTILYLNGFFPNVVPLLFGELFTAVLYDGIIVDPGSPKMRRSLAQHVNRIPPEEIQCIVATHAHEEHIGNLNWLAEKNGRVDLRFQHDRQILTTAGAPALGSQSHHRPAAFSSRTLPVAGRISAYTARPPPRDFRPSCSATSVSIHSKRLAKCSV